MKSRRMRWAVHVTRLGGRGEEWLIHDFGGETQGKEITSKTQA